MTTKREMMEGVEAKEAKIIANNTVEYIKPDGTKVIRLHHTDILEFPPRGGVIFNSGGRKTTTTKERMNEFQSQATIVQNQGLWYIATDSSPFDYHNKDSWVPFFDGVKVKNGKVVNPKKSPHKKEEFLLKQIQKYCKKMKEMDELPLPAGGDCFYCSMQTEDGKSLGEATNDKDHLKSHLKEKYIHGSLIWNALKWAGKSPEIHFQMGLKDNMIRATKRYFKSQLGLVS